MRKPTAAKPALTPFTPYEKFVVGVLAFLQFTIILDFMILSPLGAILMPALNVTPSQFGVVVSAYAFCAGGSGLLAAGFADRFDRKRLLLFFYCGFLAGTLCCGLASSFRELLAARMLTGLFGGVIGSIVFAITTDLFPLERRGRVMGIVQTAFAASQVLGLPLGLYLANHLGWHGPFLMIVAVGLAVGVVIALKLKPVDAHLKLKVDRSPFRHLAKTFSNRHYLHAFATMALLSTGGFMLMPYSSAFSVNNVGISLDDLPILYMVTGVFAIFMGPWFGRLSDTIGKFKVFCIGSAISSVMVLVYTNLGTTPLLYLMGINVALFAGISARMVSASSLVSAIPGPTDRGSFMSVGSSLQQISGGLSAAVGGMLITQNADGSLGHFDRLGYVLVGVTAVMLTMMYSIDRAVKKRQAAAQSASQVGQGGEAPVAAYAPEPALTE
jgi:predicted MFS family arabinose efflux permease